MQNYQKKNIRLTDKLSMDRRVRPILQFLALFQIFAEKIFSKKIVSEFPGCDPRLEKFTELFSFKLAKNPTSKKPQKNDRKTQTRMG